MKVREIVYDVLSSVYKNKAFSNIELSQAIRSNDLSDLDRTFLTRVVYGTLQNARLLDYEISQATQGKELRPEMRTLLKSALYQLRYMDKVPDYAVINETVDIAKNRMGINASKFANAVLRKLQGTQFIPKEEDFKDNLSYISLINSQPEWAVKMIAKHYGEEVALNWVKANRSEAPLSIRVNTLKSNKEELLATGKFAETKLSPVGLHYIANESIATQQDFLDGKYVIQDESGQLVAPLLAPKPHETILDMCAAPGSKTYHMAALMRNLGKIVAIDYYPHRLRLLEGNLPRLGISCVQTKVFDSTKLDTIYAPESFDRVLLDAPCSGLGVARRKPDILINLNQNQLDDIIALQQQLIDQAVKLVKVNGVMVYSTCTLDKKENELQIRYLIEKYPAFKLVESRLITPDEFAADGFFMAKLVKEKSL